MYIFAINKVVMNILHEFNCYIESVGGWTFEAKAGLIIVALQFILIHSMIKGDERRLSEGEELFCDADF